ncbi:ATPase and permease component [Pseudomonas syringae pv. actinidiae]|uniref:ATPase and permease component n=1 Tax=Pseudomonas syringae pv. actinidiae TaxID=103796 RepID=A0A2V0QBS2_PSESF|nr:ATPase and permease component [Pseudomonas syringae pv. actinidiae]
MPSISSKPLCISRQQSIFFFTDLKNRDLALPGVIQAAQKSSLEDFIVFFG